MKMARITSLFVALATVLVFGSEVMAQSYDALGGINPGTPNPSNYIPERFSGVVESVYPGGQFFTVKNDESRWMTFYWDNYTQIMHGQKTLSPTDLNKGEHLTVVYRDEGGKATALKVDVSARVSSMQGASQVY